MQSGEQNPVALNAHGTLNVAVSVQPAGQAGDPSVELSRSQVKLPSDAVPVHVHCTSRAAAGRSMLHSLELESPVELVSKTPMVSPVHDAGTSVALPPHVVESRQTAAVRVVILPMVTNRTLLPDPQT